MKAKVNLRRFIEEVVLAKGEWELSYHDPTHLKENCNVPFASARFEQPTATLSEDSENMIPPFALTLYEQAAIEESLGKALATSDKPEENVLASTSFRIIDQVGESLQRIGMLPSGIIAKDWAHLEEATYLVVVLDTSALRRRIASTLLSCLKHRRSQKPIWVLIPLLTTLEIEQHRAEVKKAYDARPSRWKRAPDILRRRASSTVAPLEIQDLRRECPVEYLELYPNLPAFYSSRDQRKNDRLMLEGLKSWMKQRGIQEKVYLITADLGFAQMAYLEGIPSLFSGLARPVGPVRSVRFDFFRGEFVAYSLHELLWDLAHVFACVRARRTDAKHVYALSYYYPGKTLDEVFAGMLELTYQDEG